MSLAGRPRGKRLAVVTGKRRAGRRGRNPPHASGQKDGGLRRRQVTRSATRSANLLPHTMASAARRHFVTRLSRPF
jgi:hypothetical protein